MSADTRNVLVKCGDSRKPVTLQPPWKKQQLTEIVKERFSIPRDVPVLLQTYQPDWEEYVDLEDDLEVLDRCKVNCIVKPNIYSFSEQGNAHTEQTDSSCPKRANAEPSNHACSVDPTVVKPVMFEKSVTLPQTAHAQTRRITSNILQHDNNVSGMKHGAPEATRSFTDHRTVARGTPAGLRDDEDPMHDDAESLSADVDLKDSTMDIDNGCDKSSWPVKYCLPVDRFSKRLKRSLDNQLSLDWPVRHELIQCLSDSILQYTSYPSHTQREEVLSALFQRYPHLATGELAYNRWRNILIERFKNIRRKMTTPAVLRRKRKHKPDLSFTSDRINEKVFMDGEQAKYFNDGSLDIGICEESSASSTTQTISLVDDGFQQEYDDCDSLPSIEFQDSAQRREEILSDFEHTFGQTSANWPQPYTLPKQLFPKILLNALNAKRTMDGPKMNLLFRCLSDEIQSYTIFPSVRQREEVVASLVQEYPHLKDFSPTGWSSHFIKLSERFKNIRRKLFPGRRRRASVTRATSSPQLQQTHFPELQPNEDADGFIPNIKIEINDR